MEHHKLSSVNPFLRSCFEESPTPLSGEIKGEIPKWLKGSLLRVGSGLLQIGPDHFNHLFDGMALLHRFSFEDGKVTYQNKFLKSNAYQTNMKAGRIVSGGFATRGIPDPCKTIFQRFASIFTAEDDLNDNDLVNIILYADEAYACSESNSIWKIDPETLESLEKVKLKNFLPVNAAIAHAHQDADGTVYNVGSTFERSPKYKILKFPTKGTEFSTFQNASVLCSIPSSRSFVASYHHSFGMSENYFIFVEQPLYLSIPKLAWAWLNLSKDTFADCITYDENLPCRFYVVRRSDNQLLDTVYIAKSFCIFHHINAYEEDDHLIVDLCAYDDGAIIKFGYIKSLEDFTKNHHDKPYGYVNAYARRFVLPLNLSDQTKDETLVKLPKTTATAKRLEDDSIFCSPENLSDGWTAELPRINYEKYNGKKYKFYYGVATREKDLKGNYLIKGDVENKCTIYWRENGAIPSEPVFISLPNSENDDEDSGVILASLLYENDERKVSLIVLDAKTMHEIGRATFLTKSSVPQTFHGIFVNN